jgi:soluble lytic murein transglycosylase-like protein
MSSPFRSGWLILTLLLPGAAAATLPTVPDAPPSPSDASSTEATQKTGAGDEADAEAKANAGAVAKAEAKAEAEVKVEAGAKAEAKADSGAEAKPKPDRASLEKLVTAAAERHGVELALVKAVVAAESAYDPQAVSRAGARGLMQVMPATAADYGVADQERLFDPETNLDTGTRHLKRLLAKYKNDYGRAIMAYNAGEGVVDRTGSMVTYAETLSYTEAVIRHYRRQGGTKPTDEALAKVRQLRKLKGQQAKQLLAKYLDLNLPSLRGSSRTIRVVAPGLDENSARRRPMIVLETKKPAESEKLD